MARCSQQDTPSQDGDDLSLTREASELGSEEDALQQDEPEDQPEDDDADGSTNKGKITFDFEDCRRPAGTAYSSTLPICSS